MISRLGTGAKDRGGGANWYEIRRLKAELRRPKSRQLEEEKTVIRDKYERSACKGNEV
jgi:hypothetical protein